MNWQLAILCIPPAFFLGVILSAHVVTMREGRNKSHHELNKRPAKVHKELELLVALSKQLLPLKEDMDKLGANVAGRHAVVKISDWPEQYALGIEKCVGFILDWK